MSVTFLFAQVGATCTPLNPFELIAVIGLMTGAGILSVSSGMAGYALIMTTIKMITAGSSIAAILSVASPEVVAGVGGVEALTAIIIYIQNILGC